MFYKTKFSHFTGITANAASTQPPPIIKMCQISFNRSHLLLSKNFKHDTAFVYEVMSKACEYVKGNYQYITKGKYFSDGCAVQYENYKNFLNLCHHYSDFDLEAEWDFFTTSYWKSFVERIGR